MTGDGKAGGPASRPTRITVQLQNSTVADARHLLRTTMKDVDGKQEELRELVSVRYRDFIDAADTISAMGNSARTIIDTAAQLGDACSQMVAGSWREDVPTKKQQDKAAVAKDVLTIMQAPERIASSLEDHKHVAAAVHLLSARQRYEALDRSSSPAVAEWLSVPFVQLRARALMSESQVKAIVDATHRALRADTSRTAIKADGAPDDATSELADAMGASILVQGLSPHDALDTFLEARSAAVRAICHNISAAEPEATAEAAADEREESLEGLEALLRQVCLAVVGSACQALLLFCPVNVPNSDVSAGAASQQQRSPLLVTLLTELSGVPIRRDMQTPVDESECCASVRAWLQAMCAAVNAATTAALHRVRGGKGLAAIELSLRTCTKQALLPGGGGAGEGEGEGGRALSNLEFLWGKVSEANVWVSLFGAAFTKRSKQVVAARFSAIQTGIGPLLKRELQDILEDSHMVAHASQRQRRASVQQLFQARHPPEDTKRDADAPAQPWAAQCTPCALRFLSLLQEAVLDCQKLVGDFAEGRENDAGGRAQKGSKQSSGLGMMNGSSRAGLAGNRQTGDGEADERSDLLWRSASDAVRQLSQLLEEQVAVLDKSRKDVGQVGVDQALYLAQTSSAVETHVASILELLPRASARGGADGVSGVDVAHLQAVARRGYAIWVSALVGRGRDKLGKALREMRLLGDDAKRAWEAVEVPVESESGENKTEKLAVPCALLPHSLCLLLDAVSAIHDVQTPPLALQGGTVQELTQRLADAVVAEHESLADEDLGGVEALHIQVVFDLQLCLDVLMGHELGSSLAARAKALEQRLLKPVDPIDYSFLAPLLHTNRSKAYQRHSVMLGALVQVPHPARFGLLPAVDTWSSKAAASADIMEDGLDGSSAGPTSPAKGQGAGYDDLQKNVQASLGRFGSFFGQQMRNATDSFNNKR